MQEIASVETPSSVHSQSVPFRRRVKLRRRRPLDGPTGFLSRRLAANYLGLYNRHVREIESGVIDSSLAGQNRFKKLESSRIDGVDWSVDEKELFFRSLGRRGRRNVDGMVYDLKGLKSALEVCGYLTALETAYESCMRRVMSRGTEKTRARRSQEIGLLAFHELPMAYEVSDSAVERERIFARELSLKVNDREERALNKQLGWARIDRVSAIDIERESRDMTEEQVSLLHRIAPEMLFFSLTNLLECTSTEAGIERDTLREMYRLLTNKTVQLIKASIDIARVRLNVQASAAYFSKSRFRYRDEVSASDVQVATHSLYPSSIVSSEEQSDQSDQQSDNQDDNHSNQDDDNDNDNDDLMSNVSTDEDDHRQEEEEEEEALLNRHDERLDTIHENAHRPYLGLKTTLPVPPAPSFADITRLLRHDWTFRQDPYRDVQVSPKLE